ncbi:TerD family protein [Viridibacillus sp. FSL R5-0477]|uniref:Stress response protein SCP2 n=1 Tax=Viridibacillus arenosi FSL R5-213 TaxID=1227360 RepID=W4EPY5_9BACL|nr:MULTISPECIES: TerD family protein [Viridibacillus]ETT82299.1 stress response protein SCP2 [Viridibacillus arenosi FSL R5-213]OMC85284.1 stress protein [Viridibacillus sp. FSL H8-0123]OMC92599.1 stress protein [Viridibacillus arenosi]
MGINLQKGQRVDLTKGKADLNRVMVGLGWDPVSQGKSGGLLGGLFGGGGGNGSNVDCDASVLMLKDGHLKDGQDVVYFGKLKSKCGSVQHSGDNLTGDGDGDDEVITIDLKSVPADYDKLVFVVNIYDCVKRKQHFGMIQNAYIRVFEPNTGNELIRYNLSDNYADLTTLVTGEIYRHNGEWKFGAIGDGTTDAKLGEVCTRFQ